MNATTPPPPPTRARTPPSPRHGAKFDSYEPYSPRRSSRINARLDASQRESEIDDSPAKLSKPQSRATRELNQQYPAPTSTPPRKKATFKRTSSQHFSPPSSPLSPDDTLTVTPARHPTKSFMQIESRKDRATVTVESDADMSEPQSRPRNADRGHQGMLPTPAKTPRKRHIHDETKMKDTARILFTSRPATVEEAMPTPRKTRKRTGPGLTLDDLDVDAHNGDSIPIYTDSKERVPEEDERDDNPFLVRRSNRKPRSASESKVAKASVTKTKHGMTEEIDEAVKRGEGMVYVFRGKKMFRKFSDSHDKEEEEEGPPLGDDPNLIRLAGAAAHQPLKRTQYKPRRLFVAETARLHPADDNDVDEEAVTDIEAPPQPAEGSKPPITTPQKSHFRPPTPPTTVKKRKAHPVAEQRVEPDHEQNERDYAMNLDGANDYLRVPVLGGSGKKTSPFDSWHRTKPGVRSVSSKRLGDALEKDDLAVGDDQPSATSSISRSSGTGRGKRSRSGPA